MNLLFLDFETYYDDQYSLRRMPTPNYILDKRFECQMCAVQVDNELPQIVDGPDFPAYIAQFNPATTITCTFNALFDNSILAWRFGFVPALLLDAMGMARALCGHDLTSASLNAVASHLGLGVKGDALLKVKGMNREQIKAAGLWPQFAAYALQDLHLLVGIYDKLAPEFPPSERRVMDLVLRCTVQPKFRIDTALLVDHIEGLIKQKAELLAEAGVEKAELMSTAKFVTLLEQRGVVIETKPNTKGDKQIPALAKTDQFMADLLEHDDPVVQALVAARLGHKSTIEETRCLALLSVSRQDWPKPILGTMPVPLRYGAAHTHRLGGEWKLNFQNLPTQRGSKGKSRLRHSLVVPNG